MQSMGQSLQASLNGMKGIMAIVRDETRTVEYKMAAPRGGDTEPTRGSVDCVGPAMETGEVVTRDAVTIIREMRLEVMEKLMVTETRVIKE